MNQFMVTAISNEIVRQEPHAFFQGRAATFDEASSSGLWTRSRT